MQILQNSREIVSSYRLRRERKIDKFQGYHVFKLRKKQNIITKYNNKILKKIE